MLARISSVAFLLLICTLLPCDIGIHRAQAKGQAVPQTVAAHQYTLVDAQGRVTGKMENVQGSYPAIELYDSKCHERIVIAIGADDQPRISILDAGGERKIDLTDNSSGYHRASARSRRLRRPGHGQMVGSATGCDPLERRRQPVRINTRGR